MIGPGTDEPMLTCPCPGIDSQYPSYSGRLKR
jgi:hypothetical protein